MKRITLLLLLTLISLKAYLQKNTTITEDLQINKGIHFKTGPKITEFSKDTSLSKNSDSVFSTQKALKTYIDKRARDTVYYDAFYPRLQLMKDSLRPIKLAIAALSAVPKVDSVAKNAAGDSLVYWIDGRRHAVKFGVGNLQEVTNAGNSTTNKILINTTDIGPYQLQVGGDVRWQGGILISGTGFGTIAAFDSLFLGANGVSRIAINTVGSVRFINYGRGLKTTGSPVYSLQIDNAGNIIEGPLAGSGGGTLYGTTGSNTDGAITQAATTTYFNAKADKTTTVNGHALSSNVTVDVSELSTANYSITTSATSYTLSSSDNLHMINFTANSAITLTVPTGLPANFTCTVFQLGTGQITFNPSGTTLNNYDGYTKTAGQKAHAGIIQNQTNVFTLSGIMSN